MALFPKKLEKNLSERKSKKFPAKNGGMKFGFALNYQYSCVLECVLLELISELPRGLNMNSWYLYNIGSSLNSVQYSSTTHQSKAPTTCRALFLMLQSTPVAGLCVPVENTWR